MTTDPKDAEIARLWDALDDNGTAMKRALNYLENTENELGILLDSAEDLRAALQRKAGE